MTIINANEVDDTPEEMFGPYVDRNSSIELLREIVKLTNSDIGLHEEFNVSNRTLASWLFHDKIPSVKNASKIAFFYILFYDRLLFATVILNIIDPKVFEGENYKTETIDVMYAINEKLNTISLLRNDINDKALIEEFDKIEYLWYYSYGLIDFLYDLKISKPSIDYLSSVFNEKIKKLKDCEINEINDFRQYFEELNILDDLED